MKTPRLPSPGNGPAEQPLANGNTGEGRQLASGRCERDSLAQTDSEALGDTPSVPGQEYIVNKLMPSVADVARAETGSEWRVDQTGGGCEALSTTLEGGYVLVICSNLSVPEWGDTDTSLGAYRFGAWHGEDEDREPLLDDWTCAPLTPEVLSLFIYNALNALPTLLRL